MTLTATLTNRNGIKYLIIGEVDQKLVSVATVTDTMIFAIEINDFIQRWERWEKGEYIQIAFGLLSGEEREFLQTGYTPEKWAKVFRNLDEDR